MYTSVCPLMHIDAKTHNVWEVTAPPVVYSRDSPQAAWRAVTRKGMKKAEVQKRGCLWYTRRAIAIATLIANPIAITSLSLSLSLYIYFLGR